jgi:hypothetical protein
MNTEDYSERPDLSQAGRMHLTAPPPGTTARARVSRRHRGFAAAAIAGVALVAVLSDPTEPRAARAAAPTAIPTIRPVGGSGLFGPDQQPRFAIGGVERAADVSWKINDTTGTIVESGSGRSAVQSVEVHPARDLPSGTYRLTVNAPGGATASYRFLRTLAGPAAQDPYFGLGVNPVSGALPTLDALGAGTYRQDLQWSAVEKVAGTFDFAAVDARIDPIVRDRGVRPLFVLDYGHVAYTGGAMVPPDMAKPAQAAAWKRYVRETVTHMRARHPDADLSYEVWNEWTNNHGALPDTPAAYIALASVTAAVIRDADPTATIVGPTQNSVSAKERAWLADWFAAGGADHVDAVSVHPYSNPWAPEACAETSPCIEDALAWLRKTADLHPRADGTPLPIWITEVGWPTRFGGAGWVQPEDQTAYILRTYGIAARYGVERLYLFEMAEPTLADPNGLARTFGLTGTPASGYEPKTAAAGWATMQRVLAGKRFVAEHRSGAVRHMRFTSPDGKHHTRIVWQSSSQSGSTSVRVSLRGTGRLVEPTGSERPITGSGGKLDMSAKWIPRFVVWDE